MVQGLRDTMEDELCLLPDAKMGFTYAGKCGSVACSFGLSLFFRLPPPSLPLRLESEGDHDAR